MMCFDASLDLFVEDSEDITTKNKEYIDDPQPSPSNISNIIP